MQTRFKKINISSVKGNAHLNVLGLATLGVQISGTWSGTLVAEGSLDGENWVTLQSESGLMSSLANGVYISGVNGYQYARVRATAWTSGTAQVYVIAIEESHSSSNPKVTYNATPPTLADGESGSLQGDVNGNLLVSLANGLSNLIDKVTSYQATDAIMNGLTALEPKFAVISASLSGDNTVVSAVTGKKIRVISMFLLATSAVSARFESSAGGTAKSGAMPLSANGGFVLPKNEVGWFETESGQLLNLELSGAVLVAGGLTYVEV